MEVEWLNILYFKKRKKPTLLTAESLRSDAIVADRWFDCKNCWLNIVAKNVHQSVTNQRKIYFKKLVINVSREITKIKIAQFFQTYRLPKKMMIDQCLPLGKPWRILQQSLPKTRSVPTSKLQPYDIRTLLYTAGLPVGTSVFACLCSAL